MADIKQAAKWMQEGKKVKRKGWNFCIGKYVNEFGVAEVNLGTFDDFGFVHQKMYVPQLNDLLNAEDWEIYIE